AVRARRRTRAGPLVFAAQGPDVAKPLDWSADGKRLLVDLEDQSGTTLRAVLVDPTGATAPLGGGGDFTELGDLSRSGGQVLGAPGGDVVSVTDDGTVTVLAEHADSPSWNR